MTDSVRLSADSISQVASPASTGKKIGKWIIATLVLLLFVWAILGSSHKEKSKQADNAFRSNYHGTGDSDLGTMGGTSELSEKIRQMREKLTAEKLAQQEKLYRVRQAAPIAMYTASTNTLVSASVGHGIDSQRVAASVSSSADGSSLPLSTHQINKLKSMLGIDSNVPFQESASHTSVETVDATKISHTDYTLTQGTLIPGSLETAINSDLPGMVKAKVSMDVYAASGNRVLIPRGSILIGQYNAGLVMGQKRVLVVWTRVIRPDGIDAMKGSSGTDALGQGGLGADKLETHFWSRFGQASLLSIIGSAIATAGVSSDDEYNSAQAYRMAIANNFQNVAGSSLLSTMNIKPTIHVYQGARMNVFVNRDVSFYNALTGSQ